MNPYDDECPFVYDVGPSFDRFNLLENDNCWDDSYDYCRGESSGIMFLVLLLFAPWRRLFNFLAPSKDC